MYDSLLLPWSSCSPTAQETAYRAAGLVRTKGTIFLLPPPTSVLVQTFNAPPRPQSRMSAGAVALCKHFERGGSSSAPGGTPHPFWCLPVGSNENKTKLAARILEDMLADTRWRNVMLLHRGVAVYEVRNSRGFGMRWTLELELESELLDENDENELKEQEEGRGEMKGDGNGDGGGNRKRECHTTDTESEESKPWTIARTTFRGFLEPIDNLDHEL